MALDPRTRPGAHGARPKPEPSPNLRQQDEVANRVYDVPRANFILAHRSSEWQMDSEGNLLPVVVQLSKSPGVQGVGRRGQFGEARAWYEEQGLTLIPHDILPADYVALYRNEKGKKVHRTVFQQPANTADGTTVWEHDGETWKKFLRLLRVKGYVKPPLPVVVRQLLDREIKTKDGMRSPGDNALLRERFERDLRRCNRNIEKLEMELEASYQIYGRPVVAARSEVSDLLDAALEAEGEAGRLRAGIVPDSAPQAGTWTRSTRPRVEDLPTRLEGLSTAEVLAMQKLDARPTAAPHYATALLADDDDGDNEIDAGDDDVEVEA